MQHGVRLRQPATEGFTSRAHACHAARRHGGRSLRAGCWGHKNLRLTDGPARWIREAGARGTGWAVGDDPGVGKRADIAGRVRASGRRRGGVREASNITLQRTGARAARPGR
jgi:hypothetical protein